MMMTMDVKIMTLVMTIVKKVIMVTMTITVLIADDLLLL